MIVPEPIPFEVAYLVPRDHERTLRIVRVTLRRSWLFRFWRRLRRHFAGAQ